MPCSYLHDPRREKAVLYDTVTERAFGQVFSGIDADDQAILFICWMGGDARGTSEGELDDLRQQWTAKYIDPDTGDLNDAAHDELDALRRGVA